VFVWGTRSWVDCPNRLCSVTRHSNRRDPAIREKWIGGEERYYGETEEWEERTKIGGWESLKWET
jgi:hypothetical protein